MLRRTFLIVPVLCLAGALGACAASVDARGNVPAAGHHGTHLDVDVHEIDD